MNCRRVVNLALLAALLTCVVAFGMYDIALHLLAVMTVMKLRHIVTVPFYTDWQLNL
jgi:hypothetical protein